MTEGVRFHAEWEAVDGSRGDAIRATWARFSLCVNDYPVTRVLDARSGCYRDHILVPLYPVTEWLVRNWWSLFHEPEVSRFGDYARRHDLRFGREGYAFPALLIRPQGRWVALQWRTAEYGTITFPSTGSALVAREELEEELGRWVERVIGRLEACGIQGTLLQEEWAAIQQAAPEERAFCIAAAQTGLNPYTASENEAATIVDVAERLPESWHQEFFSALDVGDLSAGAEQVLAAQGAIRGAGFDLQPLEAIRAMMGGESAPLPTGRPWEVGYELATRLRRGAAIGNQPLPDETSLARLLGVSALPVTVVDGRSGGSHWLDGVAEETGERRGGLAVVARGEVSKRFAFCRGLLDILLGEGPVSALVTAARTERQKRNRAFAAELLAPAGWLRDRNWGRVVEDEAIEEAAEELGVYSEVVRRQLVNHRIIEQDGSLQPAGA